MKSRMMKVLKFCAWVLFWLAPIGIAVLVIQRGRSIETTEMPNLVRVSQDMTPTVESLSKLPGVLGAGVVIADVRSNERMMLVYNVHDAGTLLMLKELTVRYGLTVPLFNVGGVNTHRILDVINGGAVCMPFDTTLMASQLPKLKEKVKTACLFGMPIINPQFRHYFLFLLSTEVTLKDFEKHEAQIETAKQSLFLSWIQR